MTGDAEPLVALIHPNMEWRGRRRLSRFWQHHPADTAPTRPVRFSLVRNGMAQERRRS